MYVDATHHLLSEHRLEHFVRNTQNMFRRGGNKMKLNEAIEVLKDAKYIGSDEYASDYDREMNEAIDTVVAELEKPTYTAEELEGFARWYHLMICFSKNELDFVGGRPFEKVIAQWKRGRREK